MSIKPLEHAPGLVRIGRQVDVLAEKGENVRSFSFSAKQQGLDALGKTSSNRNASER
jgi:hypothetical protein